MKARPTNQAHVSTHPHARTGRAPPARGPTLLPRRRTASGHSQKVLHRDADDRAFHERPGRRQWRRWRGRSPSLARDLRRGISRGDSLGGQGGWGRGLPARSRHPGFPLRPAAASVPTDPSPGTPASRSRAICPARDTARESAPRLRSPGRPASVVTPPGRPARRRTRVGGVGRCGVWLRHLFLCTFLQFSGFVFLNLYEDFNYSPFNAQRKRIREGSKGGVCGDAWVAGAGRGPGAGGTEAGDVRPALRGFHLSVCPSAPELAGLWLFVFSVCFLFVFSQIPVSKKEKRKKIPKGSMSKWFPKASN